MQAGSLAYGWYYTKRGAPAGLQAGPFTWQQLYSSARSGALEPDDLVWNVQLPEWMPARQIPGLFAERDRGAVVLVPPVYRQGAWLPPTSVPQRKSPALYWLIPLVALILVGGGLGIYFGALRDNDGGPLDTGTTLVAESTTTEIATVTTSAATTTTLAVTTTTGPVTTTAPTTTVPTTATTTAPPPGVWTDMQPAGDIPTARCDHSLVYESGYGAVILFGGWAGGTTYLNDTWAYDSATNTWASQNPAGGLPAKRGSHAMAYDSLSGKVILFGGASASGGLLNDTWAYDLGTNTWTNMNPAGSVPAARSRHSLVYDSANRKVILFGGTDGGAQLNDTWSYDVAANQWTHLNPTGSLPPGLTLQQMIYDARDARVILFGGSDGTNAVGGTWVYEPGANAWAAMDPTGSLPAARMSHTMAYDSRLGRALIWGGWNGTTLFDDTWVYDFAANVWTDVTPAGGTPATRGVSGMAYDSGAGKAILFGGTQGTTKLRDTWAFGPTH